MQRLRPRIPSGILLQAAFLSTGKVEGLTLDATYGMKDATAGHLIFCLSGGQHPSCIVDFLNKTTHAPFQSESLRTHSLSRDEAYFYVPSPPALTTCQIPYQ
jgi:hypothetical protein